MSKPKWDPEFAPSYTPMEMLDQGVFEGLYTAAIEGIPKKYKEHKNVLKRGSEPDESINRYGVKSRLDLPEWEKRGWTTENSPLGWFEWYIKYFEGRRLEDEDDWQIKRWKQFVARHAGQLHANCQPNDESCHTKQRQALLQWAWDPSQKFTDEQRQKNLKRLRSLAPEHVSLESGLDLADSADSRPSWFYWD